jgi:hypothetical protein
MLTAVSSGPPLTGGVLGIPIACCFDVLFSKHVVRVFLRHGYQLEKITDQQLYFFV